jgi:hypothetical protein
VLLGSFQILDDGRPRLSPEGKPLYWRGILPRAKAEIVPGSWDVAGLRRTGSIDGTVPLPRALDGTIGAAARFLLRVHPPVRTHELDGHI